MFPRKLPKAKKRDSRWRSPAHRDHVRRHACSNCGATAGVEFAHLRLGSGAGIGQKPDDWFGTSLCVECHRTGAHSQHTLGEETFWECYRAREGQSVHDLIEFFIRTSPKRAEIEAARRERLAA